MKCKVLNPKSKKKSTTRKKETLAERKKRMAKVRSYKKSSKKKPVKKRTVKKNPLSHYEKRALNFLSKLVAGLESGNNTVTFNGHDVMVLKHILKKYITRS